MSRRFCRRRQCLDLDHLTLSCGEDLEARPGRGGALTGQLEEPIDGAVVMPGVVMEETAPPRARRRDEIDDVLQSAVPPASPGSVLGGGILGIVDDEVGPREECRVAEVPAVDVRAQAREPTG